MDNDSCRDAPRSFLSTSDSNSLISNIPHGSEVFRLAFFDEPFPTEIIGSGDYGWWKAQKDVS